MDLVDICLLRREGDVFANLVADIAEELVVYQVLYYRMFISAETVN
jgi:hypothetical protein